MKKILIPTDFSEPANKALLYAINIAITTNAAIEVVNVSDEDSFIKGILGDLEKNKSLQKFHAVLKKITNEFNDDKWRNIPIQYIKKKGDIVNEVVEISKSEEIDLMIITAKNTTGLEKLFGNLTEKLIKKVNCPTLVLPEHFRYKPIENITLATNLFDLEVNAIQQIHNFALMFEANFNFVHIILEEKRSYLQAITTFRLTADEVIGDNDYDIIELSADGVIQGLQSFIAQKPVDILVMQRKKKSSLNKLITISYSEKMAVNSQVPIFIFSS